MSKLLNGVIKCMTGIKFQKFWIKCCKASLIGMNIGGGSGFESSGEKYVMEIVFKETIKKSDRKAIIFDVGANIGGYTEELLKYVKDAEIHCFEPAKSTFKELSKNITDKRVMLNNFGLGETCSESILYYDKENSGLASLYHRQLDYFGIDFGKSETVFVETLDRYCKEKRVSYIDFLKMDIEGNELNALYGAYEMLKDGKIGAIQIEFGGCNIDSRTYFRDFWNLLHENFRAFRILKNGLYEIEKYEEILEIFICTNYLFLHK